MISLNDLQVHPLHTELEQALAEIAKRHGYQYAVNTVPTHDNGIAAYIAFEKLDAQPAATPTTPATPPDGNYAVLPVHIKPLTELFQSLNGSSPQVVRKALSTSDLLLGSWFARHLVKITAFAPGEQPIVGTVLASNQPENVGGEYRNAVFPGDQVFVSSVLYGQRQRAMVDQKVFVKVGDHWLAGTVKTIDPEKVHAAVFVAGTVDELEVEVAHDQVWTPVIKHYPKDTTVEKEKAPTKRELMKSRKPGAK